MIYFDNSATTQTLREAAERAFQTMTQDYYNPAAAYGAAYGVEKQVNEARAYAASLIGAKAEEIIYTSGGTESNNMAVYGSLRAMHKKTRIVTTETEHPSVFETMHAAAKDYGLEISYVEG